MIKLATSKLNGSLPQKVLKKEMAGLENIFVIYKTNMN